MSHIALTKSFNLFSSPFFSANKEEQGRRGKKLPMSNLTKLFAGFKVHPSQN